MSNSVPPPPPPPFSSSNQPRRNPRVGLRPPSASGGVAGHDVLGAADVGGVGAAGSVQGVGAAGGQHGPGDMAGTGAASASGGSRRGNKKSRDDEVYFSSI